MNYCEKNIWSLSKWKKHNEEWELEYLSLIQGNLNNAVYQIKIAVPVFPLLRRIAQMLNWFPSQSEW